MKKILIVVFVFVFAHSFGQKCLVRDNQIVEIGLPNSFESFIGSVSFGYGNLPDSIHYKDGWRNIVTPQFNDSLQYLGSIYYNQPANYCTYPIITKSQDELLIELNQKYDAIDNSVDLLTVKKLLQVVLKEKLDSLSDDQIKSAVNIYDVWRPGKQYQTNEVVSHDSILYRVIQPHTSQLDWKPNVSASLFTAYRAPETISQFVQPTGSHDAYMKGEKVVFNGSIYESLIDNNVWSPVTYPAGWKLI